MRVLEWELLGDPCQRASKELEISLNCFGPLTISNYEMVLFSIGILLATVTLALIGWCIIKPQKKGEP